MTVVITAIRKITENNDYALFHEKAGWKVPHSSNYNSIKTKT